MTKKTKRRWTRQAHKITGTADASLHVKPTVVCSQNQWPCQNSGTRLTHNRYRSRVT